MLQLHLQNYNTTEELMALHWKYSDHLLVFFNPLMLELNLSEERCLPEFFTGDFKFWCILLGEKTYYRLFFHI